jgi:hypothetical protein
VGGGLTTTKSGKIYIKINNFHYKSLTAMLQKNIPRENIFQPPLPSKENPVSAFYAIFLFH